MANQAILEKLNPPKFNRELTPEKLWDWKTILSFMVWYIFSGGELLGTGRVTRGSSRWIVGESLGMPFLSPKWSQQLPGPGGNFRGRAHGNPRWHHSGLEPHAFGLSSTCFRDSALARGVSIFGAAVVFLCVSSGGSFRGDWQDTH